MRNKLALATMIAAALTFATADALARGHGGGRGGGGRGGGHAAHAGGHGGHFGGRGFRSGRLFVRGYSYGSSCWRWRPTRYGLRRVWVCGGYPFYY